MTPKYFVEFQKFTVTFYKGTWYHCRNGQRIGRCN